MNGNGTVLIVLDHMYVYEYQNSDYVRSTFVDAQVIITYDSCRVRLQPLARSKVD